jgi:hypothetical protein
LSITHEYSFTVNGSNGGTLDSARERCQAGQKKEKTVAEETENSFPCLRKRRYTAQWGFTQPQEQNSSNYGLKNSRISLCNILSDVSYREPAIMNNRISPLFFGPISSKASSVEKDAPSENLSRYGRSFIHRWGNLCFVLLLLSLLGAVFGALFLWNPDVTIGLVIVVAYAGLYRAYRRTQDPNRKSGYPIIHYRGHSSRKKGFFS